MSLEVISSGFLSLLQDFGRYGLQRKGVTHGGPLDEPRLFMGQSFA